MRGYEYPVGKIPKMKLADKLWYMMCYAKEMKDEDLEEYSSECAEHLQDSLKKWLNEEVI